MKNTTILCFTISLMAIIVVGNSHAEESSGFVEALRDADIQLHLRLRYEDVEQNAALSTDPDLEADALTLKTRLTYTSKNWQGLSLTFEMDDVSELDDVDYRTAGNDGNNPGTAMIADPEGTEVNQAYIRYSHFDTTVKAGRQRVLLDNQRFVGGVGWRQNEQTYDAYSIGNKSLANLSLFYAYIHNVNRIFGEDNPIGDHDSEIHLANVKYDFGFAALTGYGYFMENKTVQTLSSDTLGIRFAGKAGLFAYSAEYATQSDGGDNPNNYDADFIALEGSVKAGPVNIIGGYQLLGEDAGNGRFITPLATLHKFQGWADKFLGGGAGNVAGGIEDVYLSAVGNFGGFKIVLAYHDFSADDSAVAGADDYGSEINISVSKKLGPASLLLKYADYSADDFATDTSKLWLQTAVTF